MGFKPIGVGTWSSGIIKRILTNEMYVGDMVQGRSRKLNYRLKKITPVPEEEWIKVEGMHDPIVSKSTFELVQNLLQLDVKRPSGEEKVYPLSGLIKCGDCGQNMIRRVGTNRSGKKYGYYHCSTNKSSKGKKCKSHLISEIKLYEAVEAALQNQIKLLTDTRAILKGIDKMPLRNFGVQSIDNQLGKLNQEIEHYTDLKAHLYKDRHDGIISEEEYESISTRFDEKMYINLSARTRLLEKRQALLESDYNLTPWIRKYMQAEKSEHFERREIVEIVDQVIVYY